MNKVDREYPTIESYERKIITQGIGEYPLTVALLDGIRKRDAHILRLQVALESRGKECCPKEERFVGVTEATGSSHRLTINPVDGRITLKVSPKASDNVKLELRGFANKLLDMNIPPLTLRGKITWHERFGYECQLMSDSKKVKIMIREKEINE